MASPSYMIVEDGSAKVNSNAYWDIDSTLNYLLNQGYLDWENYTQDQQARAIIAATSYIEKRFRRRFRGLRQSVEQALGWPRIGAFDDDSFTIFGVPFQIQFACAEYAIRAARLGVLAPDPFRTAPPQDLSQPTPGLTVGTDKLTATANFNVGDTITIGLRTYTFVSANPSVDGQVLVGGTLAASLNNLFNCINNTANIATGLFTTTANFNPGDTVTIGYTTYFFVSALNPTIVTAQMPQVLIGVNAAATLENWASAVNFSGGIKETYYALGPDSNVTATFTSNTLLATANTIINLQNFNNVNPIQVALTANTTAGTWAYSRLVLSGGNGTNYFTNQADTNVVASVSPTALTITSNRSNANSIPTVYTPSGSSAASWATGTVTGFSNNPVIPQIVVGPVRTQTQKVGPLEESRTFDGMAQRAAQDERTTRAAQSGIVNDYYLPEYPEADLWIEQIVRNPATGTRLIRGS